MGLRSMAGKMTLIAILLCLQMVDLKPKHYLIEVADSPIMEHGFDYHEQEFEYQQHMHQPIPQDEGNVGKVEEPNGYDSKANEDAGDAVKPEEPNGYESKTIEAEEGAIKEVEEEPNGYESKVNEDEGSTGNNEEPNGYESKTSEAEGGAVKPEEPKGYEEEKSSPANSAERIRRN